jgi:hypothetical protein
MSLASRVEGDARGRWDVAFPSQLGAHRPLCFLHIAKTGGTSLTEALARLYPSDHVFSDQGNLWVGYLERLGDRLAGRALLAGHAGQGVAAHLRGRADIITLLRDPADQAVSNYLHVLADPDNALHTDAARVSFPDYLRRHDDQIDFQVRSLALALGTDITAFEALRLSPDALTGFLQSLPFVGVAERMEVCAEVLSGLLVGDPGLRLNCINTAVYRGVSTRTLARLRQDYLGLRQDPYLAPIFAREARLHAAAERILARLDADRRSERGARGAPTPAGFISSKCFHTAQAAPRGASLVAPLERSAGHMIHGPYTRLAPGHYRARFHLRLEAAAPGARGRVELEAACNGDIRLNRRWLRAADFARARGPTIAFTHPDGADVLEFRVRARGFTGGRLVFDGVTISPAGPRGAWPSRVWRAVSLAARGCRRALGATASRESPSQRGVRISS